MLPEESQRLSQVWISLKREGKWEPKGPDVVDTLDSDT